MRDRAAVPRALLALLWLAVASGARPAAADLVVEIRATANEMMLARSESRIVCSLRADRACIETRTRLTTLERPDRPSEETRLILVRGDLGVSWVTAAWDTSYTEAPWPDTLTCPPALLPGGLLDSVGYESEVTSLDWTEEITRAEVHDTIAGHPAEQLLVRAVGRPGERAAQAHARHIAELRRMNPSLDEKDYPPPPKGMDYVHELWLAQGVPAAAESLWARFLSRSIRTFEGACLAGPSVRTDSLRAELARLGGLPFRWRVTLELPWAQEMAAAVRAAQAARRDSLPRAPGRDSLSAEERLAGELFDGQSGATLLSSYEVVSIREEPVPDERYELPAGFRKKPRSTLWDSFRFAPVDQSPR